MKNEEYDAYMEEIESLIDIDPDAGTKESDRLGYLSEIIERYEADEYFVDEPTKIEALRFRMEQENRTEYTKREKLIDKKYSGEVFTKEDEEELLQETIRERKLNPVYTDDDKKYLIYLKKEAEDGLEFARKIKEKYGVDNG